MKNFLRYYLLVVLLFALSSCDAIGAIFKAGAWTGIIGLLLVVGIVIWLLGKLSGGRRG
jgi:hypothetical protein